MTSTAFYLQSVHISRRNDKRYEILQIKRPHYQLTSITSSSSEPQRTETLESIDAITAHRVVLTRLAGTFINICDEENTRHVLELNVVLDARIDAMRKHMLSGKPCGIIQSLDVKYSRITHTGYLPCTGYHLWAYCLSSMFHTQHTTNFIKGDEIVYVHLNCHASSSSTAYLPYRYWYRKDSGP